MQLTNKIDNSSLPLQNVFLINGEAECVSPLLMATSYFQELLLSNQRERIELPISKEIFAVLNKADNFETLNISRKNLGAVAEAASFLSIGILLERCKGKTRRWDLIDAYEADSLSSERQTECYECVSRWLFENKGKDLSYKYAKLRKLAPKLACKLHLTILPEHKLTIKDKHLKLLSEIAWDIPYLDLSGCENLTSGAFEESLGKFENLKYAIFSGTHVTSEAILPLIGKVRILHLENCLDVGDDIARPLWEEIETLQDLKIEGTGIIGIHKEGLIDAVHSGKKLDHVSQDDPPYEELTCLVGSKEKPFVISPTILRKSHVLREAEYLEYGKFIKVKKVSPKIFALLNDAKDVEGMKIPKKDLRKFEKASEYLGIEVLNNRCGEKRERRENIKKYQKLFDRCEEAQLNEKQREKFLKIIDSLNEWLFSKKTGYSFDETFQKRYGKLPTEVQAGLPLIVPRRFKKDFEDEDLKALSRICGATVYLDISGCKKLTKEGLEFLKAFPNLNFGNFQNTNVSDEDIVNLIPRLKMINLSQCKSVTREIVAVLEQGLAEGTMKYMKLFNCRIPREFIGTLESKMALQKSSKAGFFDRLFKNEF